MITIQAAIALTTSSRPGTSGVTLIAAGISLVVLAPSAYAKCRLGARMASRALQGDGALSGIGAATSLLALTALAPYHTLGWWWADRVTALIVAAVAAMEAWRTVPRLLSHWPQRAGEYRSAISKRSKSGRAYRPSGGGPAWQSRGRVWRRVWAPS